jgi:hypothetical protein
MRIWRGTREAANGRTTPIATAQYHWLYFARSPVFPLVHHGLVSFVSIRDGSRLDVRDSHYRAAGTRHHSNSNITICRIADLKTVYIPQRCDIGIRCRSLARDHQSRHSRHSAQVSLISDQRYQLRRQLRSARRKRFDCQ